MDTHLPVSAAANEPTTLPLPFPDQPSELGDLPDGAANEPPVELDALAPPLVSRPPREPRFDPQRPGGSCRGRPRDPGGRGRGAPSGRLGRVHPGCRSAGPRRNAGRRGGQGLIEAVPAA